MLISLTHVAPLLSNHYSVILSHVWSAAKESRAGLTNLSGLTCQIWKLPSLTLLLVCHVHLYKTKEKHSCISPSRPSLTLALGTSTKAVPEIENQALTSPWPHHCHPKGRLTPFPKCASLGNSMILPSAQHSPGSAMHCLPLGSVIFLSLPSYSRLHEAFWQVWEAKNDPNKSKKQFLYCTFIHRQNLARPAVTWFQCSSI